MYTDKLDHYDSRHRNPLYCRADLDCCTELILFTKHHHPSVAIFAQALLNVLNSYFYRDMVYLYSNIRYLNERYTLIQNLITGE